MFNSKYRLVLTAPIVAAALAGCDTEGEGDTQGGEAISLETDEQTLNGFVNRGFAGSALPQVALADPDGGELQLNEAAGTPVLLNVWATWCVPCITEMPMLDALSAELGGEIQLLTVSADLLGADKVVPFFAANALSNLPQWMDQENQLSEHFGGGGKLPLSVMYDAQGREVWRIIGAFDWESEEARSLIDEAIEGAG